MENLLLQIELDFLTVSYIFVGLLIGILSIIAFVLQIIILIKYYGYNKKEITSGYTAFSACRNLLDSSGMQNVKVEKCGFFRSIFYGNSYSRKKKTIFLRGNIIDKNTVTAVGIGLQKVGLAIQDRDNDSKFILKAKLEPFALFAPIMFIPIVLVGLIVDYAFKLGGVATIVTIAGAGLYLIFAFVFTLVQIPVDRKANNKALEILKATGLMNDEEIFQISQIFKYFEIKNIIDFVIAILEIIRFILKIVIEAKKK